MSNQDGAYLEHIYIAVSLTTTQIPIQIILFDPHWDALPLETIATCKCHIY